MDTVLHLTKNIVAILITTNSEALQNAVDMQHLGLHAFKLKIIKVEQKFVLQLHPNNKHKRRIPDGFLLRQLTQAIQGNWGHVYRHIQDHLLHETFSLIFANYLQFLIFKLSGR